MKRVWVIFEKEIFDGIKSPFLFLFLTGFLLLSHQLYLSRVFLVNQADLSAFFAWIPLLWILFLPSLTLERWSLEFKLKTIDLLRALPLSTFHVALAKFLAALALMTLALLLTLPLVITISRLGALDMGLVASTYLGCWLVGIVGLSIGLFFSKLSGSGVMSYVITVLCLIVFTVCAHPVITQSLPSILHPILHSLSLDENFKPFLIGLIPAKSALTLLALSVLFLVLQSRQKLSLGFLAQSLVIFVLAQSLFANLSWSFDATHNHKNSLSNNTVKILQSLNDRLIIKTYFSKDVPLDVQNMQNAVDKILHSLKEKAKYDVAIEPVTIQNDADLKAAQNLGLTPLTLRVVEQNAERTQDIVLGLILNYRDKTTVIPDIVDASRLEYQLALNILKLSADTLPQIGVLLPEDATKYKTAVTLLEQLGKVVPLNQNQTHFDNFNLKTVLVIDPQNVPDAFSEKINSWLNQNVPITLFLSTTSVDDHLKPSFHKTGFENYLKTIGVTLTPEMILDADNNITARFDLGNTQTEVDYPFWVRTGELGLNKHHAATAELSELLLPWAQSLQLDNTIWPPQQHVDLVQTSPEAFLQESNFLSVSPQYVAQMKSLPKVAPRLVATQLHWPDKAAPLTLVAATAMIQNNFLNPEYFAEAVANADFLVNLVEQQTWGDTLIQLRNKMQGPAPLKTLSTSQKNKIYFGLMALQIFLPILLWICFYSLWRQQQKRIIV